jgi:hypothetical protein
MLREDSIMKTLNLLILVVIFICSCTNNVDIDEFMDNTLMEGMPVPDRDPMKLFLDQHEDHKAHQFPRPDEPNWYTCTHYTTKTTKEYIVMPGINGIDGTSLMIVAREHFPALMDRYEFKATIDKAIAVTQKAAGKAADIEEYNDYSRSTMFIWHLGDGYVYSLSPYPETRMIQYSLMYD